MNSHLAVATHALTLLVWARRAGRALSSAEMARSVNTNPVFLRRVLASLRNAGLVETHEGAGGGYALARPPGRISLADVFLAVQAGAPLLRVHHDPNPACEVGGGIQMSLGARFERAEAALLDELRLTTLDTLYDDTTALTVAG